MFNSRSILLLYVIFAAMIVVAIIVPFSTALLVLLAGVTVVSIITIRTYKNHSGRVENIRRRLSNLKSEGLFVDNRIIEEEDIFYNISLAILKDLERTIFKLVEKNVQLLSLKEIGRTIISSLDEKKLIESVFDYLMRGIGYKEVAFIIVRRKAETLQGIVSIEKNNKISKSVVNFDIKDLKGAIFNSLKTGKSFLIKDIDLHPIEEIDKKKLFPGSTMSSYICVPLVKSSGKPELEEINHCVLNRGIDGENKNLGDLYLTDCKCLSCQQMSLLGLLIVTDGYRATPLTNIDQVTVETVGSLVSSNIENLLLYQELRQAEKFREKVFEGMTHGLVVTDLNGKINFANRSAKLMTQMDIYILEKLTVFDLVRDMDSDKNGSYFFDMLQRDDTVTFHEGYLKRADGYDIPIRLNISKFLGENNEVKGAIVLFVDLSVIKKMEEEIRHLDRLALLGRFTSAIAHEIRNPLTGIGAGVQYLRRSSKFSDEQNLSINSILSEVERLDRIISDLFKVAKPRDILYQKVDLSELIERSYNSVKELFAKKGVEFIKDIDDNILPIEVDPDQMIQVLINLIKNGVEATGKGGKVIARGKYYNEVVNERNIKEKKKIIRIEIIDNGTGIDEKSIERIFEPFFSKKSQGTGLGLFVSHSIIQHHHGKIDAFSRENEGTTIQINLPVNKHER